VSGFQKVALPLGILVLFSGIAGLVRNHFKPGSKAIPPFMRADKVIEAGGVMLHVPAGYVSTAYPNGRDVELNTEPGNFSIRLFLEEKVRMGKMDFWLQNEFVSRLGRERMRALMSRRFVEKNFRHVADRPYSLAGQDGICSEYRVTYGGEVTYGTRLGIVCTFDQDEYASFEGTLLGAADFYKVIESAESLQRNN